jgi:hydroxymethylpyrimidine/phosphomethylpyrimidine kinase
MVPTVLAIGGSDSSGGAGIGRDLRALHDLRVHGIAVITAVTAQTNADVRSVHVIPPDVIGEQIETALASGTAHAVKIGMLATRRAVEVVARCLQLRSELPVVLDPVLTASSGPSLLHDDARGALLELLFPRATVVTPNAIEAASLLGEPAITDAAKLEAYARHLLGYGSRSVLLKGGHAEGDEAVDILVTPDGEVTRLGSRRRLGTLRGTGCALASAIAAGLAHGLPLLEACRGGKRYMAGLFDTAA